MRDLDEIPEQELNGELQRRETARAAGLCDYCGRRRTVTPTCKFPKRHGARTLFDEIDAAPTGPTNRDWDDMFIHGVYPIPEKQNS